jgi:hypothetical protein
MSDYGPKGAFIPGGEGGEVAGQLRVVAAAYEVELTTDDARKVRTIISAPPPARHHNLCGLIHYAGAACIMGADESGFLLSDGTFASRRRAACVAIAAGQVEADAMTVPGTLFSEDLW